MTAIYSIRDAVDADRGAIYEMYEELFREDIERIWGWKDRWQQDNFAEEWEGSATRVIECEPCLAGYMQTKVREDHVYLLGIALGVEFQRRGIGRAIMGQLQREAGGLGLPLKLSVFRTQPWRVDFYESLGFSVTETGEEFVRMEWAPGCGAEE